MTSCTTSTLQGLDDQMAFTIQDKKAFVRAHAFPKPTPSKHKNFVPVGICHSTCISEVGFGREFKFDVFIMEKRLTTTCYPKSVCLIINVFPQL